MAATLNNKLKRLKTKTKNRRTYLEMVCYIPSGISGSHINEKRLVHRAETLLKLSLSKKINQVSEGFRARGFRPKLR